MIGLRDKRIRRFGAAIAGLAVYLQLAFASWGLVALPTASDPTDALGGHALCLASDAGTPRTAPADTGPVAPAHDHFAFCCLWHSLPGVTPQAALTPVPVAYTVVMAAKGRTAVFYAAPPRGPAEPRAPPILT
jgi:hypothetical protein